MTSRTFFQAIVLGGALTASACGAGRPRTETVTAQRLKDSAPEKRAALRGATPGLDLEAEDARWGIEAAKERKRASDPRTNNPPPAPPISGATAIDVKTLPQP
jgi:hypothetical protein